MGKLIIHAGFPKTGTTSLQAFLYENRKLLKKHNLYYEMFYMSNRVFSDIEKYRNGIFLNYMAEYTLLTRRERLALNLDFLQFKRFGKSRSKTVLLSYENLILHHTNWKVISDFIGKAGFGEICLVVYVRPQDASVIANWKQGCKGGYRSFECKEYLSKYNNRKMHRYYENISSAESMLKERIPDASVTVEVRLYNRSNFKGGDIYHDFLSAIGCPWDDSFVIPEDKNTTISLDVAQALYLINKDGFPSIHEDYQKRSALMQAAEQYSIEHPEAKNLFPLTVEERVKLMDEYSESNRLLCEHYLGGDPDVFPGRPVPTDYTVWEADNEKARLIADELLARI